MTETSRPDSPDGPAFRSEAGRGNSGFATQAYLHEVFGLRGNLARSTCGHRPIPITVCRPAAEDFDLVPDVREDYVWNVQELKYVLSAVEMGIPVYIWGHKGVGKTEMVEQICARTRRPLVRVQHTSNTEESQIVGQWTVKDGSTVFEYGPLPTAMKYGWAYLADEYDFGLPNVLGVYQAMLEGKPLMIKEAPADMRVVRPHPDFRFFATGNTNGTGDETGLYQGTVLQNAANFDRFGLVLQKGYMARKDEIKILERSTVVTNEEAGRLVDFAAQVRKAFDAGKISDTISVRTLIFAARLGVAHASFRAGLQLAFLNKLSATDRAACDALAMRIFGMKESRSDEGV